MTKKKKKIPHEIEFHVTASVLYRFGVSPDSTCGFLFSCQRGASVQLQNDQHDRGAKGACSVRLAVLLVEKNNLECLLRNENKQPVMWSSVRSYFHHGPLPPPLDLDSGDRCPTAAPSALVSCSQKRKFVTHPSTSPPLWPVVMVTAGSEMAFH